MYVLKCIYPFFIVNLIPQIVSLKFSIKPKIIFFITVILVFSLNFLAGMKFNLVGLLLFYIVSSILSARLSVVTFSCDNVPFRWLYLIRDVCILIISYLVALSFLVAKQVIFHQELTEQHFLYFIIAQLVAMIIIGTFRKSNRIRYLLVFSFIFNALCAVSYALLFNNKSDELLLFGIVGALVLSVVVSMIANIISLLIIPKNICVRNIDSISIFNDKMKFDY